MAFEWWPLKGEDTDKEYPKRIKSLTDHKTRTHFGAWISYYVVPKFKNNVIGIVYFGAAFLVLSIGMRGLRQEFVLGFELEHVIKIALYVEFFLILMLSFVTIFEPEENNNHNGNVRSSEINTSYQNVAEEIEGLTKKCLGLVDKLKNSLEDSPTKVQKTILKAVVDAYKKEVDTL